MLQRIYRGGSGRWRERVGFWRELPMRVWCWSSCYLKNLQHTVGRMISRLKWMGPTVLLPDKVAETLGLAMHELTTNALKYGALSVPMGQVRVQWRVYPAAIADPPQRRLVLDWQESCVPITDLQPSRSGFGRELIEHGLPYELGASTRLEFRPGGIRCLIEFTFAERHVGTPMLMESS